MPEETSLADLLSVAPNLPDVWGEGALFAFSGMDGETHAASGFVATYAKEPYGLLIHTPLRRLLRIDLPTASQPRLATGDVYAVETAGGALIVAFKAWHTLIGLIPPQTRLHLQIEGGQAAIREGAAWVSDDPAGRDALALIGGDGHFALAYGRDVSEALQRARSGLAVDLGAVVQERLMAYQCLPQLTHTDRDRLLKKCFSVIKVNSLSAEGCIRQGWSTPDRVPHRDMWLWDSVFHSLPMNHLRPELGWEWLQSVLETQKPDGLIPHQASVTGWQSTITQPPLLAWAVWENYLALPDRSHLEYALPRLERYLVWDLAQRDRNGNSLLEWHIEDNLRCRSGESGLDNSPRFDCAVPLDAVDFSSYAAQDARYLACIARELGLAERAALWQGRSRAISSQIHRLLWDEAAGFYTDRGMEGDLSPVMAVSGFLPLLLDDIAPDRVERLVQVLQDPTRFGTAFPVPSVAVSDPAWSTDMWRGPTWLNTNYLIIKGLRQQGKSEVAAWLSEISVEMVAKYYRRYGVVFEFFDAKDQVPPTHCDRKGAHQEPYDIRRKTDSIRDYHFTAALVAKLLLEERER